MDKEQQQIITLLNQLNKTAVDILKELRLLTDEKMKRGKSKG